MIDTRRRERSSPSWRKWLVSRAELLKCCYEDVNRDPRVQ